jgi:hypothetical protein
MVRNRSDLNIGERGIAVFPRGEWVEAFLAEHLRNLNLKRIGRIPQKEPDKAFQDNESFWRQVTREAHIRLDWVRLHNFMIVDWYPRSPGLYHTRRAQQQRWKAKHFIRKKDGIVFYEPRGKTHMIEGGLGSVRFKPVMIEGEECQLCTATQDRCCHTGVPLAIPKSLLHEHNYDYTSFYSIIGQLRFLPDFLERHFYHISGIPQLYVLVDALEHGKSSKRKTMISPMLYFNETDVGRRRRDKDYVTYVTAEANTEQDLKAAAEWLDWYVHEHHGKVITNYDEQRPMFKNAPFSLQNVMNGKLNNDSFESVNIYHADVICERIMDLQAQEIDMSENITVKIGDNNSFSGDLIVATSIRNSFNKADHSDVSKSLKAALKKLTVAVAKMAEEMSKENAEQAANDLQSLTNEATSSKPRKKWWKLSAKGLQDAAKAVGKTGVTVAKAVAKVTSILECTS